MNNERSPAHVCEINGTPATVQDLAPLAFAGYGHYTSMQVRDSAVRGLDLHLERLRRSSGELFGASPDADELRGLLQRAVVAAGGEASVQITMFSRDGGALLTGAAVRPDVLVRTSAPVVWDQPPMRVQAVPHERLLPHVKNADTLGLTLYLRQAIAAGFDDAAFLTPDGQLSEGTIWNIAFADARGVVWPEAPALPGITQALVRQGLGRLGVPWRTERIGLADLPRFTGAAFMNPGHQDNRSTRSMTFAFRTQPASPAPCTPPTARCHHSGSDPRLSASNSEGLSPGSRQRLLAA